MPNRGRSIDTPMGIDSVSQLVLDARHALGCRCGIRREVGVARRHRDRLVACQGLDLLGEHRHKRVPIHREGCECQDADLSQSFAEVAEPVWKNSLAFQLSCF
jgi:hypothetical protein